MTDNSSAPQHPANYPVFSVLNALSRDADRTVAEMVGGKAWTGRELRDGMSCYTQALTSKGLQEGARVCLLAANSVEVLILQNAIGFAGACSIPLHGMSSIDDHVFAIEDAKADALIYDPKKFSGQVEEICRRTNRLKVILALGDAAIGENLIKLADSFKPAPIVPPKRKEGAPTRLAYSGGTTGRPKAIPGNPRMTNQAVQIMLQEWEWPINPRVLAVVPLSHAGGSLFAPTLLKHGTLFVMPTFEPKAVLEAIEKYKINCTMLVPTMIYTLLDHPDFNKYDLSSLETVFYGASLMSPIRLKEAIERIGPVFFQFYGQAEAPMVLTAMRKSEHDPNNLQRLASCGRPVPFVDLALLGDDGAPVPDGEPGEICVRGPLVMDGYLNQDELNKETFAGGWLHTGDIAVKDPDGFLRIVDRKKDMIVTGGFNVFPSEVENVIVSHPAVAQAAVFGVPDEKWGEAVKAVVVLRPGATVDAATLVALVRERKGPVHAPKSIVFVDQIPNTAIGKPDKKVLRKQFAS